MATITQNQQALFNQSELGKLASPTAKLVLEALADEKWDFRTSAGISKETGLPEDQVLGVLGEFPGLVRRSPVRDRLGRALYTLRSRKMKYSEVMSFIRLLLAKSA
jgi:hypothetical protein